MRKHRLIKRLVSLGADVAISWHVQVNGGASLVFNDYKDVVQYLSDYRKDNVIFNLQLFRVEIYSL